MSLLTTLKSLFTKHPSGVLTASREPEVLSQKQVSATSHFPSNSIVPRHIAALQEEANQLIQTATKSMSWPARTRHTYLLLDKMRVLIDTVDKEGGISLPNIEKIISELKNDFLELDTIFQREKPKPSSAKTSLNVAIIDTETTGLTTNDQPISVAVLFLEVAMPSGKLIREIERYHGLREPTVPIHPQAQAVHGMTIEALRGCQLDLDIITRICFTADLLIAHNAKFDRRMLAPLVPGIRTRTWACSMLALRDHWRAFPGRSLSAICSQLEIETPRQHDAMADCQSLAAVLFKHSGETARSRTYMGLLAARPWAPDED